MSGNMLFSEKMLTLDDAAHAVPGSPSRTTLWRWCVHGIGGVKLDHRRVGRKIWTSLEALERFTARLAHAGCAAASKPAPCEASAPAYLETAGPAGGASR